MLLRAKQTQAGGGRSRKQTEVFNGLVKEFVISTIGMVKDNIHEDDYVIEQLLTLLQNKLNHIYGRKTENIDRFEKKGEATVEQRQAVQKLESAVDQLSKESDNLSERLFDLSQNLVQKRIIELEFEKRQLQEAYSKKISRMKNQYENQITVLFQELKQYKKRCHYLEECLQSHQDVIKRSSQKVEDGHKSQLAKYLQIIQQIYEQIQMLKSCSLKQSLNQTQESIQPNQYSQRVYPDNYSEQYYNHRKDERISQPASNKRIQIPTFNYDEYYNFQEKKSYPSRQESQIEAAPIIAIDRRSVSKNKYIEPSRFAPNPTSRQNYYINPANQRRQRSRSSQKQKRNSKSRPIILHFANQPSYEPKASVYEPKSPTMKQSDMFTRRSTKGSNEGDMRRVEEKNSRMQGVQQKLHGLKRKLQRQLRTMKV